MSHNTVAPLALKELAAINWSAVARLINVHPSTISKTLHGHRRNPRVRRAICVATRLDENQIWPEERAS
jgi:hypothetical protein